MLSYIAICWLQMHGKHENHLQRALRLTQPPWALQWQSWAGQALGVTQQVTFDAITKTGAFPTSSAKFGFSIEKFPTIKQDDILIYLCIMQAVSTGDKPGRGCVAHKLATSLLCTQWENEWAILHLVPGTAISQAVTTGLPALHSHPCLPHINQFIQLQPWAAALSMEAICFFLFPCKRPHQCVLAQGVYL